MKLTVHPLIQTKSNIDIEGYETYCTPSYSNKI